MVKHRRTIENISRIADSYRVIVWIALALVVRLYKVDSPLIGVHSWRQADTAAMSRNFYTNGFNLFYPQIDWGGAIGYCETEFPIYSYIVALFYKILGLHDSFGRALSIVYFFVSIWFLYRLAEKYFGRNAAFWSGAVYSMLPLNIYYSRTFQPESMLMMCCIIGIYYFDRWIDSERSWDLIISGIFVSLACLIKVLPLIYLGVPLIYLAWNRFGLKVFAQLSLWIYSIFIAFSVFAWYYHAHNLFIEFGNTFGFSANSTNRYDYAILLTLSFWTEIIFRVIFRNFAIFCFPIFIAGLLISRNNNREYVFDYWLIAVALTWILVPVTSVVHEYYQLPFMLPAAVIIGRACDRYLTHWRKAVITCLCLALLTGSILYATGYMSVEQADNSDLIELATQVKANTPRNSLVVASTGGDPTLLYLSDRRGWLANRDAAKEYIVTRQKLGARYLLGSFKYIENYREIAPNDRIKVNEQLHKIIDGYPNLVQNNDNFIVKLPALN
jgi:4-amino-4-deoxy-L-arabinose transferase-like glycosyltransferase